MLDRVADDQTRTARQAFDVLQAAWLRDGGLTLDARKAALKALRQSLVARADDYVAAIDADFRGRSRHETLIAEIVVTLGAIDYTLSKMAKWSKPRRIRLGFPFWPASAELRPQPRGVAGIIAPFNYPLQLAMMPLIGALSAGCRALIKPSELTPRTAALIGAHLGETLPPDVCAVVTGGADVAAEVTQLPLGILLFTGSPRVGAIVAQAAAANLTPLILELGGKSPVIVDDSADIDRAAASIVGGKLLNAGQTCVAPDYVFVPRAKKDALIASLQRHAAKLYPAPGNGDLSAVASDAAITRLTTLAATETTIPLLHGDLPAPQVAPLLIDEPSPDSDVMQHEIFGPLLPILAYDSIDEPIARIRALPPALAIYWFGDRNADFETLAARTQSGAICVNDTVIYAGVSELPFGGIGTSGLGRYHGKAGFDAFSFERPVFMQSRFSVTRLLRPPYGRRADMILSKIIK